MIRCTRSALFCLISALAWYFAPHGRFVVFLAVIVGVYVVTIVIMEQRWRAVTRGTAAAAAGWQAPAKQVTVD